EEGGQAAGPLGAAAGAVVGGVTGGVAGLLGGDQRPRFCAYGIRGHRASFRFSGAVRVGAVLSESGAAPFTITRPFGVSARYRYAVVNDEVVLVEPRTRKIVQVVD